MSSTPSSCRLGIRPVSFPSEELSPLTVSSVDVVDEELRERFLQHGYLYLKKVFDAKDTHAALEDIVQLLVSKTTARSGTTTVNKKILLSSDSGGHSAGGGCCDDADRLDGSPPGVPLATPDITQDDIPDMATGELNALPSLNALLTGASSTRLRSVLERVFGAAATSSSSAGDVSGVSKTNNADGGLKTVQHLPQRLTSRAYAHGTFTGPHLDSIYVGPEPIVTTWIPLHATPPELGGLCILSPVANSDRARLELLRKTYGKLLPEQIPQGAPKWAGVDPHAISRFGWKTSSFEVGDVVIFDSACCHMSTANLAEQRMRVSVDARWLVRDSRRDGRRGGQAQSDDPVVPEEEVPPMPSGVVDLPACLQEWGFVSRGRTEEMDKWGRDAWAASVRRNQKRAWDQKAAGQL